MGFVVVVTGASSGVGRATVREFAAHGADLALIARGAEALEATRREVEQAGRRALVIQADVADPDAVEAAAARVESELGPIDVWVNCAMSAVLAPVMETDPRDFKRVMEVSYLGYVHGTQAAVRRMRERDRGVVVQVGSALAYRAIPLQATYCSSKFAIRAFTDSLRAELMHEGSGVHVTMVQLPGHNTPQFDHVRTTLPRRPRPVPPAYQPEVAARAIVLATRKKRREWYVGGSTYKTIIGNKLAPWAADRYLARTNIDAQQDEPEAGPPQTDDYLYHPLPGDRGAHGRFDGESRSRSPLLWLSSHRRALGLSAVAAVASAAAAAEAARRRG